MREKIKLLSSAGTGHFYVTTKNKRLHPDKLEVRKFEPRIAVFAGPTGMEVITRLVPQARAVLKPGGWLVMEISGTISGEVGRLLAAWDEVQITPDLQSIPRVAKARRPRT